MNKNEFRDAIETLKLYRRAELVGPEGDKLIRALYVDPYPNEHVLQTLLKPNTTFLIGRKGTGKSTIFQRVQAELDTKKNSTWAYIDIKTLFESSTSELVNGLTPPSDIGLSSDSLKKIYVFRAFVKELVCEIKSQIKNRIQSSLFSRVKEKVSGSVAELFEDLDSLLDELDDPVYFNSTALLSSDVSKTSLSGVKDKKAGELKVAIKSVPSVEAKAVLELVEHVERSESKNYSQVYIRIFKIRDLIKKLKGVLNELGLRHLYIFIDDFSELPKVDMEEVVDTIITPFNNWSDEFIKLKVAVYPGRLYTGDVDRSKVDEVYLDIYRCYGRNDVSGMERKAIDFTKRLVTTRLEYYCTTSIDDYLDADSDEFWRQLFYSCLGNPRILGYILYYCYETNVIYDQKITTKTIRDAAKRYYEEKIAQYFKLNKFLHESFEERSSIYSLKELFEDFVKRAKGLRSYRESKVMRDISGRPPTSHFHIFTEYDSIVSTLELNFFITKYYEMRDRDGKSVSVYALNYGLCQQEALAFGRPQGKTEYRLYFVERIFDYSPIVQNYLKVNQEIVCDGCGQRHEYDMLPMLQMYDMLCPVCKAGKCRVVNLSRKYEDLINSVAEDSLLPATELGILQTLHDEQRTLVAKEIAADLDCSYQLIGKRGKNLSDKSLVLRTQNERGRRIFGLSNLAKSIYFADETDGMDFETQYSENVS
ncbi:hypothetical protein [Halodesulfovibrio aestuarii]|uniref:hypothetical protein n=1 Tax=Halodesulfovibrio aestuarii TaxID=126333 RepID=UPI003D34294D